MRRDGLINFVFAGAGRVAGPLSPPGAACATATARRWCWRLWRRASATPAWPGATGAAWCILSHLPLPKVGCALRGLPALAACGLNCHAPSRSVSKNLFESRSPLFFCQFPPHARAPARAPSFSARQAETCEQRRASGCEDGPQARAASHYSAADGASQCHRYLAPWVRILVYIFINNFNPF